MEKMYFGAIKWDTLNHCYKCKTCGDLVNHKDYEWNNNENNDGERDNEEYDSQSEGSDDESEGLEDQSERTDEEDSNDDEN